MRFSGITRTPILATLAAVAVLSTAAGKEPTVAISGSAASTVKAGGKLLAKVKFAVPAGFHIYSPSYKSPDGTGVPVTFSLQGAPSGYRVLAPKAPGSGLLTGTVTMTVPIATPKAATKGKIGLTLVVNYQQCNDRICLPPTNATVHLRSVIK